MFTDGTRGRTGGWLRGLGFGRVLFLVMVGSVSLLPACGARATDLSWNSGLENGIPNVPVVHDVTRFGAVGNGVHNDAPAFQAALNAVPSSGGAVMVPPGTYLLNSGLVFGDGRVLRGSGADVTHLQFDLGGQEDHLLEIATYERGSWVSASSGYQQGSTHITVSNSSSFNPPTFAEIAQTNDAAVMYTQPDWNQSWAQDAVGEIVEVVSKSGNTLTLAEPLRFSYSSNLNPRIRRQGFVENAGVEDLHVDRLDSGYGVTILLKNAARVWVRGVESEMTSQGHVIANTVYRAEIRDSYFHHAHSYGGGGAGYGVQLMVHTTACLVENNIFNHLRHSMLVNLGSNDNVFAYNYSREPTWQLSGTPGDMLVHGHYPFKNLFEGNVVQQGVISDYWGPAGPDNTMLRNCVQSKGIAVLDHSDNQNVIGNTLPVSNISVSSSVQNTFVHGNRVNGTVTWDPGTPDHTIPTSLYMTSRPLFFGDMSWPPIGGDLGAACTNPAMERWFDGTPILEDTSREMIFADGAEQGDLGAWSEVVVN